MHSAQNIMFELNVDNRGGIEQWKVCSHCLYVSNVYKCSKRRIVVVVVVEGGGGGGQQKVKSPTRMNAAVGVNIAMGCS